MMGHLGFVVAIAFLMACSAFFSGVEIAFVSVNKMRLKRLAHLQDPKAKRVHALQGQAEEVLTAILIGNNISIISATALFTLWVYPMGAARAEWLSTLLMTPLVLIFAEIIPKVIFKDQANQLIFHLVGPLHAFFRVFRPAAVGFLRFVEVLITRILPSKGLTKNPYVSKEELRHLIEEGQQEGLLEPHERRVIERIFEFGAITVKEVMTRPAHIVSITPESTVAQAKAIFKRSGYTRLPVKAAQSSAFEGMLHIMDCVFEADDALIQPFVRRLMSVSEDTVVQRALIEMRMTKQRLARVENQAGETLGLVTVKDLIAI